MNLSAITLPKLEQTDETSKILTLAVPIGGILVSILVVILVIWPKITQVFELRTANEQFLSKAQTLEAKAKILSSLNKNLLEDQVLLSEQLLPSDKNSFTFLRQIEVAAALSGVTLDRVDVVAGTINEAGAQSAPAPAPQAAVSAQAPSVQLRLSVSSDYQSLLKFMSSIYSFSRVSSIGSLAISTGGEGGQLRSAFTVDGFWKQLPESLGSIEAPVQKLTATEEKLLSEVESGETGGAPAIPEVPKGRQDLFTPF